MLSSSVPAGTAQRHKMFMGWKRNHLPVLEHRTATKPNQPNFLPPWRERVWNSARNRPRTRGLAVSPRPSAGQRGPQKPSLGLGIPPLTDAQHWILR